MCQDCISNSKNSYKIRKEVKNGKDRDVFSVLGKQQLGLKTLFWASKYKLTLK